MKHWIFRNITINYGYPKKSRNADSKNNVKYLISEYLVPIYQLIISKCQIIAIPVLSLGTKLEFLLFSIHQILCIKNTNFRNHKIKMNIISSFSVE